MRFSPSKFTLRDLIFRTFCLVEGTKAQLMGAAAVKGVHAGAKKVGVEAGSSVVALASKAVAAAEMAKDAMSLSTATERTIKVDVTVDLVKEPLGPALLPSDTYHIPYNMNNLYITYVM